MAGAAAQQLSVGFGCQLAKQEVLTSQPAGTLIPWDRPGHTLSLGQRGGWQRGGSAGGRQGDGGRMLWEAIEAIGNVVRIWDGWWGGGVEQEYRTQFHSKLGFINDAALRTACFLTCKESVKCCLFFSLRLFSSLLCSFLYCHPML